MDNKTPTAGIVLAAGTSSRFGKIKQLQRINGKPLVEWVLDACLDSQLERVYLVLGHEHKEILRALAGKVGYAGLDIVINPDYGKGQSTSLRAGIKAVKDEFPSAMFVLGDQPLIDAQTLNLLMEKFRSSQKNICVPFHDDKRGNPVIFSNTFYARIAGIRGDEGARQIIESNPDQVLRVALNRSSFFWDVDTPEDLELIRTLTDYR